MRIIQHSRRHLDFDDIEMDDIYTNTKWSICVRVVVKFPPNSYGDDIRFILMDKTGAKIEAIVAGNEQVNRFKLILESGKNYTIHNVSFHPNAQEMVFRNIGSTFECAFDRKTNVVNCTMAIPFPLYPKEFTPYSEVVSRPNKTCVDLIGIVIVGRYPYAEQYREITIMDLSGKLMNVGIKGGYLIQHSYRWSTAGANKPIVSATMLRKNRKFGCLDTNEHTTIAWNPTHPAAAALQELRQKVLSEEIDLKFVRSYLEQRWAYLATVVKATKPARRPFLL